MYTVTAYRWGWLNGDQYPVYCGPDRTKALALAENEQQHRGGKYGCAVYEWNEDGTDCTRIAYFGGSMEGENVPFHNWKLDYFQSLGHVLEGYADGNMLLPDPNTPGLMKYTQVEKPPEFILKEVQRARERRETFIRLDAGLKATTQNETPTPGENA